MDAPPAGTRALAERLLALEAASPADSRSHEAVRVCEQLRSSLSRFAGDDGFTALLRRALALARKEAPSLNEVKVTRDGHLEGFEEAASEAGVSVVAHLLGLLVTFIGEPLTLALVREIWPDAPRDTQL